MYVSENTFPFSLLIHFVWYLQILLEVILSYKDVVF